MRAKAALASFTSSPFIQGNEEKRAISPVTSGEHPSEGKVAGPRSLSWMQLIHTVGGEPQKSNVSPTPAPKSKHMVSSLSGAQSSTHVYSLKPILPCDFQTAFFLEYGCFLH